MNTQNNQLVNTQTGELSPVERISADGRFIISIDEKGKHSRKMIYKEFASVKPETREQTIALFKLLNEEGMATQMKEAVGVEIDLRDVILQPYDSINEDTGVQEYGVVTYLIAQNNEAFVTSSKSVYNTVINLFKAFGEPSYTADNAPKLKIVSRAGQQKGRTIIDLSLIG